MEQLYLIESGIKRKAEEHECENCGEVFLRRTNVSRLKKYCSNKCKGIARTNKIEVQCFNCGKTIKKTPSKLKNAKHGFYFCGRKCKEEAQSLKGKCSEIRPSHYGLSMVHQYQTWIKKQENPVCEGCGEDEKFLLTVHHIDGNRNNNSEDNFEIVCANCHIKRHLKKVGDDWIYDTQYLTPRNQI